MIKALIIDDEPSALKGLESILKLFCPEVEVLGFGTSVLDGLKQIKDLKPELVFLDIELSDGTGFDILEQLDEINFAVIFVTAYEHYAVKAFRLNALDYLLKPTDPDELIAAVAKAKPLAGIDYKNLLKEYHDSEITKISVPGSKETVFLELKDIIRMESSSNYTYIYCLNTKPLLISRTLKSFEELLPESSFIRCHQRHIVNLNHVCSYIRNEGAVLIMPDNNKIPISRANRARVDQVLKKKYPTF